jgi:hypothetical protein
VDSFTFVIALIEHFSARSSFSYDDPGGGISSKNDLEIIEVKNYACSPSLIPLSLTTKVGRPLPVSA